MSTDRAPKKKTTHATQLDQAPYFWVVATVGFIATAACVVGAIKGVEPDDGPGKGNMLEALLGVGSVASEPWIWVARIGFVVGGTVWSVYLMWWSRQMKNARQADQEHD